MGTTYCMVQNTPHGRGRYGFDPHTPTHRLACFIHPTPRSRWREEVSGKSKLVPLRRRVPDVGSMWFESTRHTRKVRSPSQRPHKRVSWGGAEAHRYSLETGHAASSNPARSASGKGTGRTRTTKKSCGFSSAHWLCYSVGPTETRRLFYEIPGWQVALGE